jgi:integrase
MAGRRLKGQGSVYALTLRRRDGSTYTVYKAEYKERTRTARTKREAEHLLVTLRGEVDAPSAPLTLQQYAAEWLEHTARHRTKAGSQRAYEQRLRLHLLPALGAKPLTAISVRDVQRLQSSLIDRGLAPNTVSGIMGLLSNIMQRAEASDLVARNPVRRIVRAPVPDRDPAPITPAEALAILAACPAPWLSTAVVLALYLGLREGEALGLRWRDLDWERGRLTVAGQWTVRGYEPPKGKRTRVLPLIGPVAAALRTQRAYLAAERLRAGGVWAESDYVFATARGRPPWGNDVWRRFGLALRTAGLPHRTYHELRHGTATLLAAQGVPERVIAEVLGHRDVRVTSRTYTQVSEATVRSALETLERVLEG